MPQQFKMIPPKKFEHGRNACSHCRSGKHDRCRRLKLDGTMCTCACPRATAAREDVELEQMYQERIGPPVAPVEAVQSFSDLRRLKAPLATTRRCRDCDKPIRLAAMYCAECSRKHRR